MLLRLGVLVATVLGLTACSGSHSNPAPSSPTPTSGTASVSIVNGARSLTTTAYAPNPIAVAVGTTVTWVNNDTSTHNSTADNGAFATGSIAPGSSASVKLQTAGTFPYRCTIHPGMVATLTVQ